nr:MAG: ORF1 [TTV-like mini virus]
MPWYGRRRWNRRRYRRYWRGPRKTFRRRFWRRRYWVRKRHLPKRKLKKLILTEWQPKSIVKCKIKGFLCLFQTGIERISFNFDMYDLSWVPERLPGGGGWGLKNISLNALFEEHNHCHNVWTKTNNDRPLVRYTGCKIKLFQSENIDYAFTYSTSLPLNSNLQMYNSMQSSIHMMLKNSIKIPSKRTQQRKRPYKTIHIRPPTQMTNKWYFQKDIANIPLVMFRASAISMDHYYIGTRKLSTNISIFFINPGLIKNRNFKYWKPNGYFASAEGTQVVYLYTSDAEVINTNTIQMKQIGYLGNTTDNKPAIQYDQLHEQSQQNAMKDEKTFSNYWGNPFYKDYLNTNLKVYQSLMSPARFLTYLKESPEKKMQDTGYTLTETHIVDAVRYNPYKDTGIHNSCYFLPVTKAEQGWGKPTKTELINEGLPLWLLLWGYPDYQKRIKVITHIDDEHILTINTDTTTPTRSPLIIINESFIEGHSPYENRANPVDNDRWYPCFQFQQIMYNIICTSGPGTPKIPEGDTVEAKMQYCFYFKWGGNPPPMSTIEDPKEQPTYAIPSNIKSTNSLQNPETAPERLLYSFDQRRHEITKKALKRISKDWETEKTSLLPTDSTRFAEPTILQTQASETSSDEEKEEENLYLKLQQQRNKQQRLKQRIVETLQQIQNLE